MLLLIIVRLNIFDELMASIGIQSRQIQYWTTSSEVLMGNVS